MTAPCRLDPRVWLLWGLAASVPPLLGRNPLVLAAVLCAALGVRGAWAGHTPEARSWRTLVRLAALFAAIGALFNLLTAHTGDLVLVRLPDAIPILGGPLTLNALVYGLLSGLALLVLVVVWTTLGALLDWPALLRLVPGRLATVAVAGSVAFAFVPQTVTAYREIREAQAARGYRLRGARGLVPLIVPLLTGGLERAITLAEALEARGFGGPPEPASGGRRWRGVAVALGLTALAAGGYLLAAGRPLLALGVALAGAGALAAAGRERHGQHVRRTRYRPPRWTRADTIVAVATGATLVVELAVLARDPAAFQFEPYPSLALPHVNLWLLVGLALLLAPALVTRSSTPDTAGAAEIARP